MAEAGARSGVPVAAEKEVASTRGVYFAGSIRGGRQDAELYAWLIRALREELDEVVLTEHVGAASIGEMGETELSEVGIYERDMAWLRRSRAVVAEVTQPSLGVGYELGQAEAMGLPVLCLFRPSSGKSLSAMIRGNRRLQVVEYAGIGDATVVEAMKAFLKADTE